MAEAISKKRLPKTVRFFLVALLIIAVIKLLLPASNGLTDSGVSLIAVFVSTIFLWITIEDRMLPTLFALVATVVFVGMGATEVFTSAFMNNVVLITVCALLISSLLSKTGAAEYIGKWFLSRKGVKGHIYFYMVCVVVAMHVISILTTGVLGIVIMLNLCHSILTNLKIDKNDSLYRANMYAIFWTGVFLELIIPLGKPLGMIVLSLSESYGFATDIFKYMSLSIPCTIAYIAAEFLVIRLVIRPKTGNFSNYDVDGLLEDLAQNPLTKQAKCALAVTVFCFALLILQSCTFIPFVARYLAPWGSVICYFIPIILLCLIHFDGKPLIDLKEECTTLNWSLLMFMAGIMFFSSCLGQEGFGITAWILALVTPLANVLSPLGVLIFACVFAAVLTNFISNIVTMSISISIFMPILVEYYTSGAISVHPAAMIILIVFASNVAYLMPSSALAASIMFGAGYLDMKKSLIPSSIAVIVGIIPLIAVGVIMGMLW